MFSRKKPFALVAVSILLLVLTGCARIYFARPQPTKGMVLRRFPKEITGIYSDSVLFHRLRPDSLYLWETGFRLSTKDPGKGEVQIRFASPYYFVNFRDSLAFPVFMAWAYDNKLAVYMLCGDARSRTVISRAAKIDTLSREKQIYRIDPTPDEFDGLLEWDAWDVVGVLEKKLNQK